MESEEILVGCRRIWKRSIARMINIRLDWMDAGNHLGFSDGHGTSEE
jgi:hypothetical protein